MEKVRKKLIREKAVIAVYQYLLTNATDEEIENYLNNYYKPRMEDREVAFYAKHLYLIQFLVLMNTSLLFKNI